jgi:hypothetical protein
MRTAVHSTSRRGQSRSWKATRDHPIRRPGWRWTGVRGGGRRRTGPRAGVLAPCAVSVAPGSPGSSRKRNWWRDRRGGRPSPFRGGPGPRLRFRSRRRPVHLAAGRRSEARWIRHADPASGIHSARSSPGRSSTPGGASSKPSETMDSPGPTTRRTGPPGRIRQGKRERGVTTVSARRGVHSSPSATERLRTRWIPSSRTVFRKVQGRRVEGSSPSETKASTRRCSAPDTGEAPSGDGAGGGSSASRGSGGRESAPSGPALPSHPHRKRRRRRGQERREREREPRIMPRKVRGDLQGGEAAPIFARLPFQNRRISRGTTPACSSIPRSSWDSSWGR